MERSGGNRDDGDLPFSDGLIAETAGESVRATELGGVRRTALVDRLDDGERLHAVLRGRLMDYERDDDDDDAREASRTRKMASHGTDLMTVVTDRRLLLVVQRDDPASDEYRTVPFDELAAASLETANESQRLVLRGTRRYYIDVGRSGRTVAADALATIQQRLGDPETDDPIERIEQLAELHERGILTADEFEAKKRELLDRI
ncbi:SHOCT domain-containing protein [Natronorubrum halophilum]|uniref:SHOCT domain-containing protein n=1 Tax=Natronorubrum halophilum TaxID=1702106 RepID=UPI0010C1BFFA|nr:SHOCT domain-containing protein [Natronorubrum halophilum]